MLTALAMVLVVLLAAGVVFMACEALSGRNPLAVVWVCCGGLSAGVELVGALLAAAAAGLRGE